MTDKSLCLTISHNLFLNRNQRYKIGEWLDTEIEVVGVSIPVWFRTQSSKTNFDMLTSEPAEEVFCRYEITNKQGEQIVQAIDDGYRMHIRPSEIRRKLLDEDDGGEKKLVFTHHNFVKMDERSYKVVHFVTIQDEQVLLQSMTT